VRHLQSHTDDHGQLNLARYRYYRRRRSQGRLVVAAVVGVLLAGAGGHAVIHHAPAHAAAQAIAYAEAQIGKPYAWGGIGPDAYDCSGLIYMAYASAGVTIPRTSQAQWAGLRHIARGHQRPGDLVFFPGADGTWSAPGHVGLVLSAHRMVEAYAVGYPVRISHYGTPDSPPGDQAPAGFARVTG
jgi:cell wall-associated NlpC family hydrolase